MKRMLAIMAAALLLASGTGPARAAPLESADIAAGAKWFIHIDFDAARESKIGQYIHEKALKNEKIQKVLAKVQNDLGLDVQKDLHGATLYGTTFEPHTGVLIVYATADGGKLMAHLKAKPDFIALKTVDGDHTIFTWTEHMGHKPMAAKKPAAEPKPGESKSNESKSTESAGHSHMAQPLMMHQHKQTVWASFPKPDMGVFADSAADLKAALDVVGGQGGLGSTSPGLPEAAKGAVFSGGAVGLGELPFPPHMKLAKQIDSISYVGGESDGEDFDHLKLTMTNAAVVTQLKSIIDGLQAMGQLHFSDHPEVLKMIDGLKVEASGKVLTIEWKASSDDVIKFADKACEFIHKHHSEWHSYH